MKGGIRGIQPHAPDLEAALASADKAYPALTPAAGPIYKLVDSPAEALEVLAAAATDKRPEVAGRKVEAVKNPYVLASASIWAHITTRSENRSTPCACSMPAWLCRRWIPLCRAGRTGRR